MDRETAIGHGQSKRQETETTTEIEGGFGDRRIHNGGYRTRYVKISNTEGGAEDSSLGLIMTYR